MKTVQRFAYALAHCERAQPKTSVFVTSQEKKYLTLKIRLNNLRLRQER